MRRRLLAAAVLSAPLFQLLAGGPASAGPPADAPRSALVVGVSAHVGNRPAPTVGGAGDAAAFREVLARAGWGDDQVRVLTGSAATAANIRAGLQWLRDRSSDGSFSVFHYSGHVYQRGGDPDRDGEALDEFIVPYDTANIMSDRELGERLGAIRGWLWSDISGCEAAGFNEGGLANDRRLFTGSSEEDEKSYERPDWRMSVYTGLTTQAVLDNRGDANGDGHVSIQEMFRVAEREAPPMTSKQRKGTQHPVMFGGGGPEWFLNPPPPPPPPPNAGTPAQPNNKLCLFGICI